MTAESSCPGKVREKAGGEAWGLQRVLRVSHALSSEDLGPYERGRGVAKAAFQGDWWGLCAGVGQQPGERGQQEACAADSGWRACKRCKTWCALDLEGGEREGKFRDVKSDGIVGLAKIGKARRFLTFRCTEFEMTGMYK